MSIAYVLINCDFRHEDFVIQELKKVQAVKSIQGVFGIHDIIVRIETDITKSINEIISSQIRVIEKINSTLTLTIS